MLLLRQKQVIVLLQPLCCLILQLNIEKRKKEENTKSLVKSKNNWEQVSRSPGKEILESPAFDPAFQNDFLPTCNGRSLYHVTVTSEIMSGLTMSTSQSQRTTR